MNTHTPAQTLDAIAEQYVELGLQFHQHDKNPYIYIGDPRERDRLTAQSTPLQAIDQGLAVVGPTASPNCPKSPTQAAWQRRAMLRDRIDAMLTRSAILQGRNPASFDAEVQALYKIDAPETSEHHFQALAARLEDVVGGSGHLPQRLETFRNQFILPADRIEKIMTVVIAEARARTRANLDLPPDHESTRIQIDNGGPYVGFANYGGNGQTTVHFNAAVPIHLERAIELCTHEAYPGHHVQGTLIEQEMVDRRGWREFRLAPLFGPLTIMLEGAANYGVTLSFEREERIAYDRDVILPLAGLQHLGAEIANYHQFVDLVEALNYARNEAARGFLYGGWERAQSVEWLMAFGLETRATAEQRLSFIEAMRSYVVTYNHGLEWVTAAIEAGGSTTRAERWAGLERLYRTPVIPIAA